MSAARTTYAIAVLATFALAGRCLGGDGGGQRSVVKTRSLDVRCRALNSVFPPGFDFVPDVPGRVVVVDFAPPTLVPFDVGSVPFESPRFPLPLEIPSDSDGDGRPELFSPIPDDFLVVRSDFALLTASSFEEVIFYDPTAGMLREVDVFVPPTFAKSDNPVLPDPGATEKRTALSTSACVRPDPDALDSRGDPFAPTLLAVQMCDPDTPSFRANFTSGAAIAAGRLFVPMANANLDQGRANTQFLPGAVLVYDLELDRAPRPRVSPNAETPVILTRFFNPSHVTAYTAGDRELVLVTSSGAVGLVPNDPSTEVLERGGLALTDGALEVIDAETLAIVATVPLGRAALATSGPAVDPSGRVALFGTQSGRAVYAIDLAPLTGLPADPGEPIALDGSEGDDAVIFDADRPLRLPALPDGAGEGSCVPFTADAAWNHAGDRVFVTEFCDGSLTTIRVDLADEPPAPVPEARFTVVGAEALVEPIRSDTNGLQRAPGAIGVRPGEPGVDFDGPDVFVAVGEPGEFCGFELESP